MYKLDGQFLIISSFLSIYIYWCIAIHYDENNSEKAGTILLGSFDLICNIINFFTMGLILFALYKIKMLIKDNPQLTEGRFMMCINLTLFISFEIVGTVVEVM
jgi:hypothetical protein